MVEIADGDKGYRFGFPTYLLAFNKLKKQSIRLFKLCANNYLNIKVQIFISLY